MMKEGVGCGLEKERERDRETGAIRGSLQKRKPCSEITTKRSKIRAMWS